jgi:hypothetical protein
MNKRFAAIGLSAWTLVGVPLAFFLYVEWSYRHALSQGKLPFLMTSEWLWFAVFGFCLISGVIGFIKLPMFRNKNPFLAGAPYAVLMGGALFTIHLLVACGKGDCL